MSSVHKTNTKQIISNKRTTGKTRPITVTHPEPGPTQKQYIWKIITHVIFLFSHVSIDQSLSSHRKKQLSLCLGNWSFSTLHVSHKLYSSIWSCFPPTSRLSFAVYSEVWGLTFLGPTIGSVLVTGHRVARPRSRPKSQIRWQGSPASPPIPAVSEPLDSRGVVVFQTKYEAPLPDTGHQICYFSEHPNVHYTQVQNQWLFW